MQSMIKLVSGPADCPGALLNLTSQYIQCLGISSQDIRLTYLAEDRDRSGSKEASDRKGNIF